MTNLQLYRKACILKDYLEQHDLDTVSQAKLNKCIEYLNLIFSTLERRGK